MSDDGYSTLELTDLARSALRERRPIRMKRIEVSSRSSSGLRGRSSGIECDEGLFEVLRGLRKRLADNRGVPPYVIFGDVSLRQMARRYPRTEEAFLRIPGWGRVS